jgi:hypothetical protein
MRGRHDQSVTACRSSTGAGQQVVGADEVGHESVRGRS